MFTIENDGPAISRTNYWQTEHAARGLFYLSGNAGTLRLLVPGVAEAFLADFRTSKRAILEASQLAGCYDIVFDDDTEMPFVITLDSRQMDRSAQHGTCPLAVWTAGGKQLELPCEIRIEATQ